MEEKKDNTDEIMKPHVDEEIARELILGLYGMEAQDLKEFVSYDDRNFFFKSSQNGVDNQHVEDFCADGYILKITNSGDSVDTAFFEAQNEMIMHMDRHGLPSPVPIRNKEGKYQKLEQLDCPIPGGKSVEKNYLVRVLKFVPGKILFDVEPWTTEHFYQVGKFTAKMDLALKSFGHPAYKTRDSIWFLSSVPKLPKFLPSVKDEKNQSLVQNIVDSYNNEIVPVADSLERGVIHGDLNEQNILMQSRELDDSIFDVFTAIDFGDSQINPLIFELAITIMYMMTKCSLIHPNMAGGHVLAGYLTERELPNQEMEVLRTLVGSRYAQSLTLGAYSYEQQPGNEYLLITAKNGWKILKEFWDLGKDDLYKEWLQIVDSYKNKTD